ncbi:MAG: hypothetical protein E6Q42_05290 [Dechloromonas sp.]|nr:hypothetical protein [Xanthomonadales bacterium]TXI77329.1 MAG: hypothetical protein E6Q42_05290 [Dechloromonas sp.]
MRSGYCDNSGAPGGNQKTTYTYDGLTTNIKVEDTTNPSTALTMSRQVDALGRPVLTTDASAARDIGVEPVSAATLHSNQMLKHGTQISEAKSLATPRRVCFLMKAVEQSSFLDQ